MTWSYSGNPSDSDKDAVRFLIGDTNEDCKLINDEEINYLLSEENTPLQAAIRACQSISGQYSRLADRTIGDYSEKYSQKAKNYLELADKLQAQANKTGINPIPYAGAISVQDKRNQELNQNRVKPDFKKDMMENIGHVSQVDTKQIE